MRVLHDILQSYTLQNSFFPPSDNLGECMHQKNMSDMIGEPDGLDLDENSDWLHTNHSYVRGNAGHGGTASTPTGKRLVMLHLSELRQLRYM